MFLFWDDWLGLRSIVLGFLQLLIHIVLRLACIQARVSKLECRVQGLEWPAGARHGKLSLLQAASAQRRAAPAKALSRHETSGDWCQMSRLALGELPLPLFQANSQLHPLVFSSLLAVVVVGTSYHHAAWPLLLGLIRCLLPTSMLCSAIPTSRTKHVICSCCAMRACLLFLIAAAAASAASAAASAATTAPSALVPHGSTGSGDYKPRI